MNQSRPPDRLTEGPIIKSLVSLTIPIVFANILQTAYQLTDTFWVGRLGKAAVAAVSLSFPVIFLLTSLGGGLAIAGTILVAQYKGKRDQQNVDFVTAQTLILMLVISVIISFVGYFSAHPVMKLMGAQPAVLPGATSYLQISFMGLVFVFGYAVFQSLMRGVGNFIGMIVLLSGKFGIQLHRKDFKPDFALIRRMFSLGFPASIEQSTRALGMTIMTFLVASFGTVIIAAYGIGSRILSFVIIPALGLSMATSTLVGQNIGAQKIERAEKIARTSALIGFLVLTAVGVVIFFTAGYLSEFFIPGEPEAIRSSTLFIRVMALTFGFIGIQQVLNGAFRGSGNTLVTMVLSIVSLWVLRFPLAYILSEHTHLASKGIWWAFPVTNVLAAVITIAWFMKGSWKQKKITPEMKTADKVAEESIVEGEIG
ncbi:MAG: MATE family efflux transporter [Calditrichia bacterium]